MSDDPVAERVLRECLAACPEYSLWDEVYAVRSRICFPQERRGGERLLIGYNVNRYRKDDKVAAEFSLQLEGGKCYVLNMEVREALRRKGLGRRLVKGIEEFCRRSGCVEVETTPSGQGVLFWPAVGYSANGVRTVGKSLAN